MTFKDWWETSGLQNKPKNKEVALLTYGDIKLLCDMAYYSGQQASRDSKKVSKRNTRCAAGLPRKSEEAEVVRMLKTYKAKGGLPKNLGPIMKVKRGGG